MLTGQTPRDIPPGKSWMISARGQRRRRALADSGEQTPAVQVDVAPPGSITDAGEHSVPQLSRNTHRLIPDSGERTQVHNIESGKSPLACMSLKEHKRLKHGKDVPPEAQLQYLKPGIFAQALVHNKFVVVACVTGVQDAGSGGMGYWRTGCWTWRQG